MINTWNESLLHEELKDRYCSDRAQKEVPLEGSICDVVNPDGSVIEIQTRALGKLKRKLEKLLPERRVTVIFPVPQNTIIETFTSEGNLKSRRKSPSHHSIYKVFEEITGIAHLLPHNNLTITVVLSDILELRKDDGQGSWRRKGISIIDKKLVSIHKEYHLHDREDYLDLLPQSMSQPFTVEELRDQGVGKAAGKMAWVLRKAGILELAGKKGRAYLYKTANVRATPVTE